MEVLEKMKFYRSLNWMAHDFSKYDIIDYFGINMAIPEQVYSPHDDTDLISEFMLEWIKKFEIPKENNVAPDIKKYCEEISISD